MAKLMSQSEIKAQALLNSGGVKLSGMNIWQGVPVWAWDVLKGVLKEHNKRSVMFLRRLAYETCEIGTHRIQVLPDGSIGRNRFANREMVAIRVSYFSSGVQIRVTHYEER